MSELLLVDRDDLGAFAARAVRLESDGVVRLRQREARTGGPDLLDAWLATPFDVLATRTVEGIIEPGDVTVSGNELLAALAVARGDRLDPGPPRDLLWRAPLPPVTGWRLVEDLPVAVVSDLADRGIEVARDNPGPHGTPPAALLDQEVLTVEGEGLQVKIPLRCLFALSGMGFLAADAGPVRVSATESWLRIDARFGAVVRRRHALLPLLF
ncbi:MAG: hypothetical protein ACRDRN_13580 [Sciscionella sp.]